MSISASRPKDMWSLFQRISGGPSSGRGAKHWLADRQRQPGMPPPKGASTTTRCAGPTSIRAAGWPGLSVSRKPGMLGVRLGCVSGRLSSGTRTDRIGTTIQRRLQAVPGYFCGRREPPAADIPHRPRDLSAGHFCHLCPLANDAAFGRITSDNSVDDTAIISGRCFSESSVLTK